MDLGFLSSNDFLLRISFLLVIIWEAFWKGIGLWKSAKRGDTVWFVAIFLINLFGVISLIYLWHTKQLNDVITDIKNLFNRTKTLKRV